MGLKVGKCGFPDAVEVSAEWGNAFGTDLLDPAGAGLACPFSSCWQTDPSRHRPRRENARQPFRRLAILKDAGRGGVARGAAVGL